MYVCVHVIKNNKEGVSQLRVVCFNLNQKTFNMLYVLKHLENKKEFSDWHMCANVEGAGFLTYTAAYHQGAIGMFWLHLNSLCINP